MSKIRKQFRPGIRKTFCTSEQQPFLDRFWAGMRRGAADECWPWLRGVCGKGYGQFGDGVRHTYAHRLAWELTHALQVPPTMMVCHRCDNPPCCNPAHLFIGSVKDNSEDADRKGRLACGERNGQSRLSENDVVLILGRLKSGVRRSAVAAEFHVSDSQVGRIARGENWQHLGRRVEVRACLARIA